ncbi:MAG TPA: hypothetical protein VH877_34045 [Polyangia bacterium]|jgi:hypothetical protein|nr:hypothetical protein [Polyangia bacterium]
MANTAGLTKVTIKALEGSAGTCTAMFNPKELTVEKSVSWTPAKARGEGGEGKQEERVLEYQDPQPAKLSVTLFFDTFEQKSDVYNDIKPLESMAMIDSALKRPPLCLFLWGGKFRFQGVIASLTQKYTMFLADGTRVRCEVGLQMQSAAAADVSTNKSQ